MSFIARKSLRYAWPSWLVYDQNFRQEAAENPHLSWARADPGTYTESFSGQLIGRENWCSHCYSIDHYSFQCPVAAQSQSPAPGFSSAHYKPTERPGPNREEEEPLGNWKKGPGSGHLLLDKRLLGDP